MRAHQRRLLAAFARGFGATPVVSIFLIWRSCFLLIFFIFAVFEICGAFGTHAQRKCRGAAASRAAAHHLVLHPADLVLLLSPLLLLALLALGLQHRATDAACGV